MKNFVKCGIAAAVVVAAGFAVYQSYGSYCLQDNSLLIQNVEALADNNNGDPGGEPNGDTSYRLTECYLMEAFEGASENYICKNGTNFPDVIKECPNETKKVDLTSPYKSYCLSRNNK